MPYKCVRSATQQIGRVPNNPLLGGARCATADASSSTQLCIFRSGMETHGNTTNAKLPRCIQMFFLYLSLKLQSGLDVKAWRVLRSALPGRGLLNGVRSAFVLKWLKGDRDDLWWFVIRSGVFDRYWTSLFPGTNCSSACWKKSAILGRPHISDTAILVIIVWQIWHWHWYWLNMTQLYNYIIGNHRPKDGRLDKRKPRQLKQKQVQTRWLSRIVDDSWPACGLLWSTWLGFGSYIYIYIILVGGLEHFYSIYRE